MRMTHTSSLGLAMLAALALAAPQAAHAQSTIYTTQAAFDAALGSGLATAYTETFTGDAGTAFSDPFSSKGFSYTVTAPPSTGIIIDPMTQSNLVYRDGSIIGPDFNNSYLVFTFTTPNVTAVGGNFFETDINGTVISGDTISLGLNDGTSTSFTSTSASDFTGFVSKVPIQSLTFIPPEPTIGSYATVDNFTVASASATVAPEPSSVAVLAVTGLFAGGLLLKARRRRAITA
jgi:hypothetical protein